MSTVGDQCVLSCEGGTPMDMQTRVHGAVTSKANVLYNHCGQITKDTH